MSPTSTQAPAKPASALARRVIVPAIAVLILLLAGWRAYDWFVHDVEQRRAVAEGRAPAPSPMPTLPDADPAGTADAPPMVAPTAEPMAPAVRGDAIHRCVRGSEVLFSNQPCPPGFTADAGVPATAPAAATTTAHPLASPGADDPAQHQALCAYLAAEVERLDFEFQQPLPPPVLDDISSRLLTLRGQGERLRCVLPKPSEAAGRSTAKVLDEKPVTAPNGHGRGARN
ncbi:MAG TPA: hypothetical protein PKA16_11095 [Ottowia sp.]|uniref:hypothetical protein n=1 Tax=Ottowia sp. TaxID=1898956 RepID=UPI002C12CE43|nr:hypothetical protein [Ottowia sp.]HMN21924.1 hypothetical protein [Ottowia sp.]